MKEFQAYGKAGNANATSPQLAATSYFEKFPNSRKCNVIEGKTDGHFFTITYGKNSEGEWPLSFKDITKKSISELPK